VAQVLGPDGGPVVLVSDWVKALPDLLGRWLPPGYVALGTEGFGRSDTREALRALFEIDAPHVAVAALSALHATGELPATAVVEAISELGIDPDKADPLDL
jgi:pyruvate dehydrogenase E1 component